MNEGESYIPQFELGEVMTRVGGRDRRRLPGRHRPRGRSGRTLRRLARERPAGRRRRPGRRHRPRARLRVPRCARHHRSDRLGLHHGDAPVHDDDVVFVSGAAGAVGSVAGQLARKLGASKVIGSAGGPAKTERLLKDFGFDTAIDYRTAGVAEQLAEAAPDGIDVYFDNVGGDHLDAALRRRLHPAPRAAR